MILERDLCRAAMVPHHRDLDCASFWAVAHRIFQQISPDQLQVFRIGAEGNWAIGGKTNGGLAGLREAAHSFNGFLASGVDINNVEIPPERAMRPLLGSRQAKHPLQKLLQAFQIFKSPLNPGAIFLRSALPLHE